MTKDISWYLTEEYLHFCRTNLTQFSELWLSLLVCISLSQCLHALQQVTVMIQFYATNPEKLKQNDPFHLRYSRLRISFQTSKKWPPSLFTRCEKNLRDDLLKESRIPVEIEDIEVLLKALVVDPEDAIVKVCGILGVVVEMCLEFWGPVPAHLEQWKKLTPLSFTTWFWYFISVLRICDILVRIRIRGSMPLVNGSGSYYFRHWPSRRQSR